MYEACPLSSSFVLDEACRSAKDKDAGKVVNVLQTFLRNKSSLVVTLMSTKEEALLLERERKFKKGAEKEKKGQEGPE